MGLLSEADPSEKLLGEPIFQVFRNNLQSFDQFIESCCCPQPQRSANPPLLNLSKLFRFINLHDGLADTFNLVRIIQRRNQFKWQKEIKCVRSKQIFFGILSQIIYIGSKNKFTNLESSIMIINLFLN